MVGNHLAPLCARLEIVGSVRRLKPDVHDIELLARPKMEPRFDLWGEKVGEHSLLNDRSVFEELGEILKAGPRYVQVALKDGINLDLFIQLPPADWGVLSVIRTGPADFSKWVVTNRSKGGALHNGWRCEDGVIRAENVTFNFPEELDFLKWLNLGWLEPWEREPKWNSFWKTYWSERKG